MQNVGVAGVIIRIGVLGVAVVLAIVLARMRRRLLRGGAPEPGAAFFARKLAVGILSAGMLLSVLLDWVGAPTDWMFFTIEATIVAPLVIMVVVPGVLRE